jgi:HAD superfamily phosphoserine phosphatase-like hydrolase
MTAGQAWRGMRDYLSAYGHGAAYKRFWRQQLPGYLLMRLGLRPMQPYKEQWITEMLRLFAGFTEAQFAEMAEWVVAREMWPQRRKRVLAELEAHGKNGRTVIIVSGMAQPILDRFAARLGIEGQGTPLLFADGRFTGELAAPLNVGEHKVAWLQSRLGDGLLAVAYGDTGGDIPMLRMSREAVAVYPDKTLRATAEANSWRVLEGSEDKD